MRNGNTSQFRLDSHNDCNKYSLFFYHIHERILRISQLIHVRMYVD